MSSTTTVYKGSMELDKRVFELLGIALYDDKRAFVRELIQNAYDAGATKVEIKVTPKKIIIADNGHGMSRRFLTEDFRKVGKQFKKGEGTVGVYGIGRLSVWLVGDKVRIITNDGKETSEFRWNKIDQFEVLPSSEKIPRGTVYEIYLKKPLDKKEIEEYIKDKIFIDVDIYLNGKKLDTKRLKGKLYRSVKQCFVR